MTKILIKIFFSVLLITSTTLLSCKRQTIYSAGTISNSATIQISIDWSNANLELDEVSNVTVYAYAQEIDSPYVKVSGNIDSTYISLPSGIYSLLIFNDAVDDILGMGFSDSDSYSDFCAYTTERNTISTLYYTLSNSELFAATIGRLAAWSKDDFEVTTDMVSCSICEQSSELYEQIVIDVEPTAITRQCNISVEIDNLDNAQIIQATLLGFASGAYLCSGETFSNLEQTTLYSIDLNSFTFSDESNGIAQGIVTIFGLSSNESATYQAIIDIILGSGELATYTRDITDQIEEMDDTTIYIELWGDDHKIVLPESSGTGFGVDGWGDNQQIELL